MNKRFLVIESNMTNLYEDSLLLLEKVNELPGLQLFDQSWVIFKEHSKVYVGREVAGFSKLSEQEGLKLIDTTSVVFDGEQLVGDLDKLILENDALRIAGVNIFSLKWA